MLRRLSSLVIPFVLGAVTWHLGFSGSSPGDAEPLEAADEAVDSGTPEPAPCLCPRFAPIQAAMIEADLPLVAPVDRSPSPDEDALLQALGQQSSPAARRQILRGLARVGSVRSVPVVAELGSLGAPLEREAAVRALGAIGGPEATAVLIGLTEGGTLDDRIGAIEALGDTGAPEARDWLVELASRGDALEAPAAMMALADIGGPGVERELVGILRAGQLRDAVAAAKALARAGTSTARGALIAATRGGATGVRAAAVQGLAAFGDATSRGVVVAAATGDDPTLAIAGIEGLGDIGDAEAVRVLRSILLGGASSPAIEAAGALGRIGSGAAVAALAEALDIVPSNVVWNVTSALASVGGDAARAALLHACSGSSQRALAAVGAVASLPPGEDTIDLLYQATRRLDPTVAPAAMTALVSHIGEAALPMLQDLLPEASRSMQISLLSAIAQVGTPEAGELLMERARNGSPEVKSTAMALAANLDGPVRGELRAMLVERLRSADGMSGDLYEVPYILARVGGPEATDALIELARKQDSWQISPVIGALVSAGDPASLRAVTQLVRDEPDPERKLTYLQSMGGAESQEVQELMTELVRSDDTNLATAALDNLSWADPAVAGSVALERLGSDDPATRAHALGVIARTQGDGALEAAAHALKDEDQSVRAEALSALDTIGTEPARALLRGAWRDGDLETRESAVWSLAQDPSPADVDMLLAQVDGTEGISYSVVSALSSAPSPATRERLLALGDPSTERGRQIRDQLGEAGLIEGWTPPYEEEDMLEQDMVKERFEDVFDDLGELVNPEPEDWDPEERMLDRLQMHIDW